MTNGEARAANREAPRMAWGAFRVAEPHMARCPCVVHCASESCIVHRANCSEDCMPSCALCSTCLTGLLLSAVGWLQSVPGRRHWQVRASAKWVHRMSSIRPIHSVVPTRTELLNYWRVSTGRVSPWPAALPPCTHKVAGLLERARRRHWHTRTRTDGEFQFLGGNFANSRRRRRRYQ